MKFNYFTILCFVWAAVAVICRIFMFSLGKRFEKWEMTKVYNPQKPLFRLRVIAVSGTILVILTWIFAFSMNVKNGWIVAFLLTLILFKISQFTFNYERFRQEVQKIFNNSRFLGITHVVSLLLAGVLIGLGFYYGLQ